VSQVASSEHQKSTRQSARSSSVVQSAGDESVVRKLESFVESMNVRRCAVKPTPLGIADHHLTLSASSSSLERQSFPAVCRTLPPLNGLRGNTGPGGSVLLPFYVPFKTRDLTTERPLDLSSKTSPVGARTTRTDSAESLLVQAENKEAGDACDEGVPSSLESLQKQFGENSTMLDRIGVRRCHTVSGGGVAPLGGMGVRIHGPSSPLNGVGLYGPALNEPCVPPPPPRPVPVPVPDGPAGRCIPPPSTTLDAAAQFLVADRRSARRLVRGQDAWINGVSGRQRRSSVLRCLECNMSFWSLPQLTLHMIRTAHYANIVRTTAGPPTPAPDMTSSSPNMTSSCDSESSRESDVDNDQYFRQSPAAYSDDFRLRCKSTCKRQRESSPTPSGDDDCSKRSKIWRPDCHSGSFRATLSPEGHVTPNCGDMESGRPSGPEHGRAVTSSVTSSKDLAPALPLYYHSPGSRSEDAAAGSTDCEVTGQPALTAMQDFISRSICELDRAKRRPAAMPLLPSPAPPPPPHPANGLPMSVADLMFPLFPLAQFFPEQFLLASRAFNFLPLMQSLARLYGGLDVPPLDFPVAAGHKTTSDANFDVPRRLTRTPSSHDVVEKNFERRGETSAACERRSDTADVVKSQRSCRESGLPPRSTTTNNEEHHHQHHHGGSSQKLFSSPTSSDITKSSDATALDSLRGFVFGDRKSRSAHVPLLDRKYSRDQRHGGGPTGDDEEGVRRHTRHSSSVSSDSVASGAPLSPPTSGNCHSADVTDVAVCAGKTRTTTDYDSRFDKYYRLARELAGQL